jgi:hypothetical protein
MLVRSLAVLLLVAPAGLAAGESPVHPPVAIKIPLKRVVRPELRLKDANDAIKRGDYDLAGDLLANADSMPNKTADEQWTIDMLRKYLVLKMSGPAMGQKQELAR